MDTIALKKGNQLIRGLVTNRSFTIETAFGSVPIPVGAIGQILFDEPAHDGQDVIYTHDMSKLVGEIKDRLVTVRLESSGAGQRIGVELVLAIHFGYRTKRARK